MLSRLDKPALRYLAVILAGTAIAVAGMVIGWRLAGPTESETVLGRVAVQVAPDLRGDVDAFVPIADWGLRTDSFNAPFELRFEVRTLDRKGALAAASEGGESLKGLGAGGLFGAGSDFAGLGELHLFAASAVVQSVDLIRIEPLSVKRRRTGL